eukprot:g1996.t1
MANELRVGGKYRLGRKIGSGSFGDIYKGTNVTTNEEVAIKIEHTKSKHPQLLYESRVYKLLAGGTGIPSIRFYGVEGDYNVMVMDLLGASLEDLFNFVRRKFSLKTVLMLADQLISRIEFIHQKNFIHRDIKPDNFLIGRGRKAHVVYMIDFGLAKRYRDPRTQQHIPYREDKNLTGTARYASINTHIGIESSRRDDIESLGYMMMYFLRGSLPWQGLRANTKKQKYEKIMNKKMTTPHAELTRGYPDEFMTYLECSRSLRFEDSPDYSYLKGLFRDLSICEGFHLDNMYDWVMDATYNQPLVIDNGTGIIKAGFSGSDKPKCVFPAYVGRPKHARVMVQSRVEGSIFVGREAEEHRGIMRLRYPMEHGIVQHWDDMEKIWTSIYAKGNLGVKSEDHPVLLTEAPLNPRKNREKAAEIFFETYGAPAMFVSPQATLSLYASGRTTGVVLDSGDGVTHAVPVYEGFTIPTAVTRMDIAGRDVTERLQVLLRRSGYAFHTTAEREVVRAIKEDLCYVAYDPVRQEELVEENSIDTKTYSLPDGRQITVGAERFRAAEVLFNPSLVGTEYGGMHECLTNAVFKTDIDLRKTLFKDIVLAGGSTMLPGIGDRLLSEVRKKVQDSKCYEVQIRISAPPNRQYLTWVGGSILASLAAFKTMWVKKEEYEDHGAGVMHQRSL